ncbi:hypothetical protein IEN91_04420 [Bacillus velezensis]|uniref:hypothetical protein n=1 Tax=Bacillus velezensis TaxID=492670 RepID=UPI0018C53973|nr:hypothetical protein [Bacillus velezensis]QPK89699.1 hypothetical protein IEN91_04420 [Bacillus velezensis]
MIQDIILEMINDVEEKINNIEQTFGEGLISLAEEGVHSACGGNFDDAYELGYEHGSLYSRLELLRELIHHINE